MAYDDPSLPRRPSSGSSQVRAQSGEKELRVLILKDRLSAHTGTGKMAIQLARGFLALGARASVLFMSRSDDHLLIEDELKDIDYSVMPTSEWNRLSGAVQLPLLKTVLKGAYTRDDLPDIFSELTQPLILRELERADVTVFMNIWSSFPALLGRKRPHQRWVVYFHEPPYFREIPWGLRQLLHRYVRTVVRKCDLVISLSPRMQSIMREELSIQSECLENGVAAESDNRVKEDFVLADTRWTSEREPMFLLQVMEALPQTRFVMCGRFGNPAIKTAFFESARALHLEGRLISHDKISEGDLKRLYSTARCYIRWSALHGEAGPSIGVFQAMANLCVPIIDEGLGSAETIRGRISPELVLPRDPQAFAAKIRDLGASRETLQRLIDRVEAYRAEHGWERYCTNLLVRSGAGLR